MSKRRTWSDGWSSDDAGGNQSAQSFLRRARRRKSIMYPTEGLSPELEKRFALSADEKIEERQGAAGLEEWE